MFIMWSLQDLCGYAILKYKISIFLSLYPGIKPQNKYRIKKMYLKKFGSWPHKDKMIERMAER